MIKMTLQLYDVGKATEEALQKNVVPWLIKIKVRWDFFITPKSWQKKLKKKN